MSQEDIKKAVHVAVDLKELMDPIEFNKIWLSILEHNTTLDSIYQDTQYKEAIGNLTSKAKGSSELWIKDYLKFKRILKTSHSAGYEFSWDNSTLIECANAISKAAGNNVDNNLEGFIRLLVTEIAKKAKNRRVSRAESLNDQGDELNRQGKYQEALSYFEKALELSPRFGLAYVNKGIALKHMKETDKAIECYDKVIQDINPLSKKAWGNKANIMMVLGRRGIAKACVAKALDIDPSYQYAQMLEKQLSSWLASFILWIKFIIQRIKSIFHI